METQPKFKSLIFPERVEVECSFCDSENNKVIDTLDDWKIVQCECGFCYTNPRPPKEKLHLFYMEDYFADERHASKFYEADGSKKLPPIDMADPRIADIENWFDKRGSLLDIGAARGYFLRTMKARGWNAQGIEISEDAVRFAEENFNLNMHHGTIEDFPSDQKFDVITMYQTLEHVPDPKLVLQTAYEMLNTGGILLVEVPNFKAHDIKRNKERKRLQYDLPRHLNHFTPAILKREFEKCNYNIIHLDKYHPQFMLDYNAKRSGNKQVSKGKQVSTETLSSNIPMKKLGQNWKVSLIKSVSNFYPGWRFTIIGRKEA
ncbi:MAG: class I SAM-dependent methyltransferase [Chitinophagales bacterium]|nr:class I SAM-dependent methyltransferase [Chitinophagales bacterium]